MKKVCTFVLSFFYLVLWGQTEWNEQVRTLCEQGEIVCEGRIIAGQAFILEDGDIYTRYTVEVYKCLKGRIEAGRIEFYSLGGVLEDRAMQVCPSFHPKLHQEGMFFFRRPMVGHLPNERLLPVDLKRPALAYDHEGAVWLGSQRLGWISQIETWISSLCHQQMQKVKSAPWEEVAPGLPEAPVLISGVSPLMTEAGRGQVITIDGSGFGATQGSGAVFFRNANGSAGTINISGVSYLFWSDSQIQVVVPSDAGSGSIRVRSNTGQTSGNSSDMLVVLYNVTNVNNEEPHLVDQYDDGNEGYIFSYSSNTANNGVDIRLVTGAVEAVERAVSSWNSGSKFAIYGERECGETSIQVPVLDGVNVITFDNDAYDLDVRAGSSVLALMRSYYIWCGGEWEISEFDMVLRRDGDPNGFGGSVNWEYGPAVPTVGETDFESVVLHELGHGHGLGHTRVNSAVMFPSIAVGTTKRTLTSSEIMGGSYIHAQSKAYVPLCTGHGQYDDFDPSMICSIVLPLDLVHFQARNEGMYNRIEWSTVNEILHDHIVLQYLQEGRWANLRKYSGVGHEPEQAYSYQHDHEAFWPGIYQYRLKVVASDGAMEYSQVVTCEKGLHDDLIRVMQAGGHWTLLGAINATRVQVDVLDVSGVQRWSRALKIEPGARLVEEIEVGTWPSGIYFVRVVPEGRAPVLMKCRKTGGG